VAQGDAHAVDEIVHEARRHKQKRTKRAKRQEVNEEEMESAASE
jgi:hypothetical protein